MNAQEYFAKRNAELKREQEVFRNEYFNGSFQICPKKKLDYIPFALYLAMMYEVYDWRELKPYKRTQAYNNYKIACVHFHVDYEHPSNFGLDSTI